VERMSPGMTSPTDNELEHHLRSQVSSRRNVYPREAINGMITVVGDSNMHAVNGAKMLSLSCYQLQSHSETYRLAVTLSMPAGPPALRSYYPPIGTEKSISEIRYLNVRCTVGPGHRRTRVRIAGHAGGIAVGGELFWIIMAAGSRSAVINHPPLSLTPRLVRGHRRRTSTRATAGLYA